MNGRMTFVLFLGYAILFAFIEDTSAQAPWRVESKAPIGSAEPGRLGLFSAYGRINTRLPETYPYMIEFHPEKEGLDELITNEIIAYDLRDLSRIWARCFDGPPLNIECRGNALYVLTKSALYRLRLDDGFPEWCFNISASRFVNAPNLSFSRKEYRSEEGQWNPRGQMDPVFSVSEDGKKCLLLPNQDTMFVLDSDGGFVKAIPTGIESGEMFRFFNFCLFHEDGYLVKIGKTLYKLSENGKVVFQFELESNAIDLYPVIFGGPGREGSIALAGGGNLYLISHTGTLVAKHVYADKLSDLVASGDKIYIISLLGSITCYDDLLKPLWTYKNPDRYGYLPVDIAGYRRAFTSGLLIGEKRDGSRIVLAASGSDVFVLDDRGRLLARIQALDTFVAKDMNLAISYICSSIVRPVYTKDGFAFIMSAPKGEIKQYSAGFSVQEYLVILREEEVR